MKIIKKSLLGLSLFLSINLALAEQGALPKLELGASLAVLDIPNYRGSENTSTYVLPVPYVRYRGEKFKIDGGIRNTWFDSENLRLSLSGNGTLPVDEDNPEREGMEELDATVEIGPSLDYRLGQMTNSEWWLELPLRLAFVLNSDFEHIGQVFQPRIAWRKPARQLGEWQLRAAIGPIYSTGEFHDYYYAVASDEVLPSRPAYNAGSGFSGARGTFSYSRRYGQLWFGGFIRYDTLSGSVVEDSPLISESSAWMTGISVAWVFSDQY